MSFHPFKEWKRATLRGLFMRETLIRLTLASKIIGKDRRTIRRKLKGNSLMVMKLGNIIYSYKDDVICVAKKYFNLTEEQEQQIIQRF